MEWPSTERWRRRSHTARRYAGPESAYRLAFTDTAFLLREELRPVRMQLELLKPELVQAEMGIESTIVIFGSARILAPEAAQAWLAQAAAAGDDDRGVARAHGAEMSRYYDEARRFAALVTERSRATRRRSTSSPAAARASWKRATAARTRSAARASA
jgi:hypothetical protein